MSKNVLYFSKKCSHSQELIKELKENNLLEGINLICIDQRNVRLPAFLMEVPTLIVSDSKNPLIGDDAFKWIKWSIDKKIKEESKDIGAYGFGSSFSENYSSLDGGEDLINDTINYTSLKFDNTIMTNNGDSSQAYGDIQEKLDALKKERGVM